MDNASKATIIDRYLEALSWVCQTPISVLPCCVTGGRAPAGPPVCPKAELKIYPGFLRDGLPEHSCCKDEACSWTSVHTGSFSHLDAGACDSISTPCAVESFLVLVFPQHKPNLDSKQFSLTRTCSFYPEYNVCLLGDPVWY